MIQKNSIIIINTIQIFIYKLQNGLENSMMHCKVTMNRTMH